MSSHYREEGFDVARGVVTEAELADLLRAVDETRLELLRWLSTRGPRDDLIAERAADGSWALRIFRWPGRVRSIFDRVRLSNSLFEVIEPVCGPDVRQVTSQVTWKEPQSPNSSYGFHQDCRYRRPREAFHDLGASFVQTLLALDPHDAGNGCLKIAPRSHVRGELDLGLDRSMLTHDCDLEDLAACGLDPQSVVDIELEPGDVAMWNAYTVHGSGPNRSSRDRRAFLNGYARADGYETGEWAFRSREAIASPTERHPTTLSCHRTRSRLRRE